MNPKNTWLLVALAAGLFAFIWLIEPRLRPPPPVATRVMPAFQAADVTAVQIKTKEQFPLRVERTNGTWLMTKPLVYPVKAAAVENFLLALGQLSPHPRIFAEELRKIPNLSAEYGFDAPQAAITLEFGEGKPPLLLGSRTANGDELYAQLVGRDWVDVISADFLKFVPREPSDWRDTTFVNLAGLDFDRLSVVHGDRIIELARSATNKLWRLTRPITARADNPKIENLFARLQSLRVSKFVTDEATDLERYGLQAPQLTLAFGQGTNRLFSLQFGNSPTNDSSLVYARSNAQNTVVLLPRDLLAGWSTNADDFRDRHLLDLVSSLPDLIEVSNEESFKVILMTNGSWRVFDAQNQSYDADAQRMGEFLTYLARLQVVVQPGGGFSFMDVANESYLKDYGLLPPGVRSYVLKRSAPPASTNEVDFGIVTNGVILARRADEPTSSVVAVDPRAFTNLAARAIQLRERRVWFFDAADVTRLTVRNKDKTQSWVRDGINDWSLPSSPTNRDLMQDRAARSLTIEQAAGNLGALQVESFVERGDTNRAKYGIDESLPRISVDVKRGDASRTFSIDFGRQSDEGSGFYACVPVFEGQNWTNWIIVFPARDVRNLVEWLPGLQ